MRAAVACLFVAASAAAWACGGSPAAPDAPGAADATPPVDVMAQLQALPGVTVEPQASAPPGYAYYVLHFTQPVDHDQPDGPTFQQEVSLISRDPTAPLVVETDGYWDYTLDQPVELTYLTHGNQISIEHRYFGASIPDAPDWSKLTIAQMAADEHAIVTALKTIYTGKLVASGASKGGMTAVYYRRFYPDDVAATVPYVAPLSFAAGDPRYAAFLDSDGQQPCHDAVRAAAVEMLANRRAALESRARTEAQQQGQTYTTVALEPSVEVAIESLEWSFWQYYGVQSCGSVPATTASDDAMWAFLDTVSSPSDNDDASLAQFGPYYYQAYFQLGYPDGGEGAYLGAYEQYHDVDYAPVVPAGAPIPTYDGGAAMHDIDDYVQHQGAQLLFVYGQYDPWTAGAFALGSAADSLELVEADGTHGSSISGLAIADQTAATDKLQAWLGIASPLPPDQAADLESHRPALERLRARAPRIPSALRRMLRYRRAHG